MDICFWIIGVPAILGFTLSMVKIWTSAFETEEEKKLRHLRIEFEQQKLMKMEE